MSFLLPKGRPPGTQPVCTNYNGTSAFSHTLQNLFFFLQLLFLC